MTDDYKNGLVTGLAMQPLHVGTIIKRVPTAYFGVGGSGEGILSEDCVVAWTKGGSFVSSMEYVYWPENADIEAGIWYNSGTASGGDMTITGATKYNNYIQFSSSGGGEVPMASEPRTIYCWCNINAESSQWKPLITKNSSTTNAGYDFALFVNPYEYFSGDCCGIGNVSGNAYIKTILCLTRTSEWENGVHFGMAKFFVDGAKTTGSLDNNRCYYGSYNGSFRVNDCYRAGEWNQSVSANYYMIAFSNREHSEEEILENIASFYSQTEI